MRTTSREGLLFIANFEGFRSAPYQDSGGVWTIGYGHTGGVTSRTRPVTREQALKLLGEDAHGAADGVRKLLSEHRIEVNQCEFDVLVSQAFNAGMGALAKSPQVALLVAGRSRVAVGAAMEGWYVKDARHVVQAGLVRRRKEERAVFRGKPNLGLYPRNTCGKRALIDDAGEPTGPSLTAEDVKGAQSSVNAFHAHFKLGEERLDVDGEVGPKTRHGVMTSKFYLGYGKADRHDNTISSLYVRRLRNPKDPRYNPPQMLATGAARRIARRKEIADANRVSTSGGDKAVAFLVKRAGWTESPAGSNDAPFLKHWRDRLNMAWMRGQPWCGLACIAAWYYGTGKLLPQGVVYTPNIVAWARAGQHFKAVPSAEAQPGDLVVINFPGGSPVADHVELARGPARGGLIPTVGGNTSSGNSGSQANGGGIYVRTRPVGLIAVVARPI